jgi:hypothetical protein
MLGLIVGIVLQSVSKQEAYNVYVPKTVFSNFFLYVNKLKAFIFQPIFVMPATKIAECKT